MPCAGTWCAAPGIVGGALIAGAGVFAVVRGTQLALAFALFLGFSALQMLRKRPPRPSRQMPRLPGQSALGGCIGLLSGLLGAGGAFTAASFMAWCNAPMHQVVATSAALGFPVALASTAGHLVSGWNLPSALPGAFGYLYLPALLIVSLASVAVAPLGARAAHATDVARLRRWFALVLSGLAGYMLVRGLSA